MDDIAVHVNEADVIGEGCGGGGPNFVVLVIANTGVVCYKNIAAVGLVGFIDRGAGRKNRLSGSRKDRAK